MYVTLELASMLPIAKCRTLIRRFAPPRSSLPWMAALPWEKEKLRHLVVPEWQHVLRAHVLADRACDEARGDRRAVVVQDRDQPRGIHVELLDQQRAQLRVAVLFDYEYRLVRRNELADGVGERVSAHAQHVQGQLVGTQD